MNNKSGKTSFLKTKQAKSKPIKWDLYKHGLSASAINLWLKCREQFRLCYEEGLSSKYSNAYLDFGNACHYVLEKQARRSNRPSLLQIKTWLDEWVSGYLQQVQFFTPDKREEFDLTVGQVQVVMNGYFDRWWENDKGQTVEMCEQTFRVWQDRIPINGTFDLLYRSEKGKLHLRDTKTMSQINEENVTDSFASSIQFNLYLWAVQQVTSLWCTELELNVIRRPSGKPTQKDGSINAYLDRLAVDVAKQPDHYYLRPRASFQKKEIAAWYDTQLIPIINDLENWWVHRENHYFNPAALIVNHVRSEYFDAIVNGDRSGLKVGGHWQKYLVK